MQRSRTEAEQVAISKHGHIQSHQLRIAITHYMRVFDWACNNCGHTGTILKVRGNDFRTSECMCKVINRKRVERQKIIDASNLPEIYKDASIDKWNNPGRNEKEIETNKSSLEIIKKYSASFQEFAKKGYGLYLTGPNGVGKTYLSAAIGLRSASFGCRFKFHTASSIVSHQIEGWFNEETKHIVKDFEKADLLIIDDIDKVHRTKTKVEISIVDNLIRDRLQRRRPCIFTGNITIMDAAQIFSPHIYSMMKESCAELVLVGADYRVSMSESVRRGIMNGG